MQNAPYGSWSSPITAEIISSKALQFSDVVLCGDKVYFLEDRAAEGGRTTLLSWSSKDGEKELLPKEYSIRSSVHEYGGGALLVAHQKIYFVNAKDQQIYLLQSEKIQKITSLENGRFADGSLHGTSLFYVLEEHGKEVVNSIVKIDSSGNIQTLVSGNDFYSNPRISPDGRSLAYLTWKHPNMPWDGTELWVLDLQTKNKRLVAGGKTESIADPKWSPQGKLYYASDRTNFWNIFQENKKESICPIEGECALPAWLFGRSLFGFSKDGIVCSYVKKGIHFFAKVSLNHGMVPLNFPYTAVKHLFAEDQKIVFIGSSPTEPSSIVLYDLKNGTTQVIKRSQQEKLDPAFISMPQEIEYPSTQNQIAYAFYYPPCNPHFQGLPNEKPPLIVLSHGGPTSNFSLAFSYDILYWTSRGFGMILVNYGGSTGYGRLYRDRLKGQWGIVDVDDCTNAALYCVEKGLADPNRLTIMGHSAGGFTTLAALAFKKTFKAGADYFGVSDLELLTLDTHKFESHYLEGLVGAYPQRKDLYEQRSPIHHCNQINCPVILFQGEDDKVVPPNQSETMYKSLLARKIPTAYLLYPGEKHGFRKAENQKRSLESQLYFLSKIFHFPLSETIEPVAIKNLQTH